jgi:hypothetical protein
VKPLNPEVQHQGAERIGSLLFLCLLLLLLLLFLQADQTSERAIMGKETHLFEPQLQ